MAITRGFLSFSSFPPLLKEKTNLPVSTDLRPPDPRTPRPKATTQIPERSEKEAYTYVLIPTFPYPPKQGISRLSGWGTGNKKYATFIFPFYFK